MQAQCSTHALSFRSGAVLPRRTAKQHVFKSYASNIMAFQEHKVKALTFSDLSRERTEHRSFVDSAVEDIVKHPSQLHDNRDLLQGYVKPTSDSCLAEQVSTCTQASFFLFRSEPSSAPLNVAVLLSGGVDSSLALHLLKQAGHNVTAFYLQIWFQEDFQNYWDSCPWEDDLSYCRQVLPDPKHHVCMSLNNCLHEGMCKCLHVATRRILLSAQAQ